MKFKANSKINYAIIDWTYAFEWPVGNWSNQEIKKLSEWNEKKTWSWIKPKLKNNQYETQSGKKAIETQESVNNSRL
jgi:hypothetical protein